MAIKNRLFLNQTERLARPNAVECPCCKQTVQMELFRNYDVYNLIGTVKGENSSFGIAVCPHCAAAFHVKKEYTEAVKEGQTVYMTTDDLTLPAKDAKR